ncbi:hypothetical protein CGRA01v4_08625 [Colletotrichum graminicola]|nr:hypothetical protein CGRA01v4_08625 [Colletotrichum graminicola]
MASKHRKGTLLVPVTEIQGRSFFLCQWLFWHLLATPTGRLWVSYSLT